MGTKTRWIAAAGLLLVAALVWHASRRVPAGPDKGIAANGRIERLRAKPSTLRIGTFNIHRCKGRDGRRDVDRVAACLDGLDFVALSEVSGSPLSWHHDQAETLGRRLGLAWLFAPAERTWYGLSEFGNGFLTALPVTSWERIPLSKEHDITYRNAVLVDVWHQARTIRVLLTHLSSRNDRERRNQLQAVVALFLALDEPAILVGDLNSRPGDPEIRQLLATPGVVDPVGEVLGPGVVRDVDWIFVRGLRAVDAGILDNDASDHPMLWAELELLPAGPAGGN